MDNRQGEREMMRPKMECPYLERTETFPVCAASPAHSNPTGREIMEYCTTEDHHDCAVLLGHILRGGGVKPRAYRRMRLYNG